MRHRPSLPGLPFLPSNIADLRGLVYDVARERHGFWPRDLSFATLNEIPAADVFEAQGTLHNVLNRRMFEDLERLAGF
jgi:hypothetical protein